MNDLIISLGWAGVYAPVALGAIGSIIGCATAGQAAIGAMLDTESGYGRYVGISAMPSSQIIYGIVVMFTLNRPMTVETASVSRLPPLRSSRASRYSPLYSRWCSAPVRSDQRVSWRFRA